MPFASNKQESYLRINKPDVAKKFDNHTPKKQTAKIKTKKKKAKAVKK